GVPITMVSVDLLHGLAVAVWTGLAILVPLVIGLVVIIRRGALDSVLAGARFLRVLPKARVDKWRARISQLDRYVKELQTDRSPGTRRGLVLLLVSRVVAWCATTVVLHAFGVTLGATLLVGVLSVGVLISWISSVVLFGIGVADGSNYALFDVL